MPRSIAFAVACILTASAAAESAPRRADAPEQAADPNEKVVCKTFTRIGTLASRYRTCKTKGEWQRERDNLRQVNISDSCSTRGQLGGSVNPIPGQGNTFDC
jgi:hypothetical protein